jgi:hypothetical protein
MNKIINNYKSELDRLLSENSPETDWQNELKNLLTKIKFYQHERLIHLIVTMTMSILTIMTAIALFLVGEAVAVPFALLFLLFLALTAFYIRHYYKLENNVQELYLYYDKLYKKVC